MDGVRLPVPAAGDGVAGLGEVERLPVAAQRHDVEAVVGVVQVLGGRQRGGEVRGRGLRPLVGVEEVAGRGPELQHGEQHDGDDGELAVAERPPQPRVAQQQQQRQPEHHEEAADVVAERAAGGDERAHADHGVDQEEDDEGPPRVDRVHAGQRQPDQREAEEDHELRGLVEVRPRLGEREADGEAQDDGRREGGGEQQVAPPHRRPDDEVRQHERHHDHQPHGVGEDAEGDRQRRPERPLAREQGHAGQGERESEHERVLAVRQVQRSRPARSPRPATRRRSSTCRARRGRTTPGSSRRRG